MFKFKSRHQRKGAILFHCHLFKNAGTTIDTLLDKNFPDAHGYLEAKGFGQLTPDEVAGALDKNPHWRALSSHTASLVQPDYHRPLIGLVFIRHPIDRAYSVYSYERRRTDEENILNPSAYVAKEQDFKGFVTWALDESNGYGSILRNFQTRHIAGSDNLPEAKHLLKQTPCVGLVEEFDFSLRVLHRTLKRHFGNLDLKYQIQNRSKGRKTDLDSKIIEIKQLLDPPLYQELLDKNAHDFELWEYASRLLHSRK